MTSYTPNAPDLRIVSLDSLMEHEYNDIQRTTPLLARLEAEGILKNPPIVAPLDAHSSRFVVLDGANRCTALSQLGYRHILVQVVSYSPPQTTLSMWHHAVTSLPSDEFRRRVLAVTGLDIHPTDPLSARADLARRELIAYLLLGDAEILAVRAGERGLHAQNRLLNALVDSYKNHGQVHRTISEDFAESRARYPDLTALVVFPNYEPAEVLALARDGELLPPGLTRHLFQGRVLRVNFPLGELRSDEALESKNARLQDWIKHKFAHREIRFYGESTYLFDE